MPNPTLQSSGIQPLHSLLAPAKEAPTKAAALQPTAAKKTVAADVAERFHSSGAFLCNFHEHLQTHAGGKKSPSAARQVTICVGKYLYHLNLERVEKERLLDVDPVRPYLTGPHIGASGILRRLDAQKAAVHFLKMAVCYNSLASPNLCLDGKIITFPRWWKMRTSGRPSRSSIT